MFIVFIILCVLFFGFAMGALYGYWLGKNDTVRQLTSIPVGRSQRNCRR